MYHALHYQLTSSTVGIIRSNLKLCLLANCHGEHSFVPSLNDLSNSNIKLKWSIPFVAWVERCTVQQSSSVVKVSQDGVDGEGGLWVTTVEALLIAQGVVYPYLILLTCNVPRLSFLASVFLLFLPRWLSARWNWLGNNAERESRFLLSDQRSVHNQSLITYHLSLPALPQPQHNMFHIRTCEDNLMTCTHLSYSHVCWCMYLLWSFIDW